MEVIANKARQFVPIAAYTRMTGLSYATIKNALDTGQLKGIKTTSGHWKINISDAGNKDVTAIMEKLDKQEQLLMALCSHLGIAA